MVTKRWNGSKDYLDFLSLEEIYWEHVPDIDDFIWDNFDMRMEDHLEYYPKNTDEKAVKTFMENWRIKHPDLLTNEQLEEENPMNIVVYMLEIIRYDEDFMGGEDRLFR
ncbi:hypothetical protein BH10BAC5_BH10BAC5_23980 [soil metagenome]